MAPPRRPPGGSSRKGHGGTGRPRPGGSGRGAPHGGQSASFGRGELDPRAFDERSSRRRDRDELGGEQIEGRQAVRELLLAGRRAVREVLVAEGRDSSAVMDEIVDLARASGTPVRLVGGHQLAARARSEVPQGVVAFAEPLEPVDLASLATRSSRPGARPPFLVVLDGITDPHNLGSVLRSAVSAGATGAVLPRHRSAHVTPTVAKAAAGAIEYLPIALVPGVGAALETLAREKVWTVGLDEDGEQLIDDLELATEPIALVLGAEGSGLAGLTRKRCDVLARVPLEGPIASLNVAAAAAVAFFAVARRRSTTG